MKPIVTSVVGMLVAGALIAGSGASGQGDDLRGIVEKELGYDPGPPSASWADSITISSDGSFSLLGGPDGFELVPDARGVTNTHASCTLLDDQRFGWLADPASVDACIHDVHDFTPRNYVVAALGSGGQFVGPAPPEFYLLAGELEGADPQPLHLVYCWGEPGAAIRGTIWVSCVAAYWIKPIDAWGSWHAILVDTASRAATVHGSILPVMPSVGGGDQLCEICKEIEFHP